MYQNSFWDTVKGQQLADVLIKYLPTVAKNERVAKNATVPKRTKQYVKLIESEKAKNCIEFNLEIGARVAHMESYIDNGKNMTLIIFEKDR